MRTKVANLLISILRRVPSNKFDEFLQEHGITLGEDITPTSLLVPAALSVVGVAAWFTSHPFSKANAGKVDSSIPNRKAPPEVPEEIAEIARKNKVGMTRKVTEGTQKRFDAHRSEVLSIFKEHGVDANVANLVIVETNAKQGLTSSAGAKGLWQFMPATGKGYGLKTDADFDDWDKATRAAAKHLKFLYSCFGSWDLVVMAYNCGRGNVNKAIRKAGYDPYNMNWTQEQIWNIWKYVPKETKGYYLQWLDVTRQNYLEYVVVESKVESSYSVNNAIKDSPHNRKS